MGHLAEHEIELGVVVAAPHSPEHRIEGRLSPPPSDGRDVKIIRNSTCDNWKFQYLQVCLNGKSEPAAIGLSWCKPSRNDA
jgi:hypothetical protein